MSEKLKSTTKTTGQNQINQTQTEKPESEKQFLERTNVKTIINDLLDSLNKYQPDDPINYIYNYFESLNHMGDPVKLAYERLISINHRNEIFNECTFEIYQMFTKAATTTVSSKKSPKILVSDLFNKLIDLLTSDMSVEIKTNLCNKLNKRDYDAYSFQLFKSSIKLIFLCKDFLNECTSLYNEMDTHSPGSVSKSVCEVLLDQLKNSLKIVFVGTETTTTKTLNPIQCLYEISPAGINSSLTEKYFKSSSSKESIALNEFLLMASKVFIDCIRL